MKLVSLSHLEGFYYKPRVDIELLEKYHEGLICLSACLNGYIANPLLHNQEETAIERLKKYQVFSEKTIFILKYKNMIIFHHKKFLMKSSLNYLGNLEYHWLQRMTITIQEAMMQKHRKFFFVFKRKQQLIPQIESSRCLILQIFT